ncbi:MAG: DUF2730 family protein [Pseudodesulfovibrio sp.]|uniref:DUF2730 family protein n=1 Tax=Pseudodesulfovibrio sp. TaxID=2035812 RepID=UPI003D1407E7
MTDLSTLADWSRVISFLITAAQLLITVGIIYLGSKFVGRKDCDRKCKAHEDEVALLRDKLQTVKDTQAAAPTGREIAAIKEQLGDMAGDIKALRVGAEANADAMKRIERPLNLLLEHELSGGK